MKQIPTFIKSFLDYNTVIKGRSENTVKSYFSDIKLFLRFLLKEDIACANVPFDKIDISNITEKFIKKITLENALEFLQFLASERGNSTKTRARAAITLKQFFKFLTEEKKLFKKSPLDSLELPSVSKTLPKYLTQEQAQTFLNINANGEDFESLRNFCIHTFFLNSGLRLSELVSINLSDIKKDTTDDGNFFYLCVKGKGDKERVIYLNDACKSAYLKYLQSREEFIKDDEKLENENALFISKRKKRITGRAIQLATEKTIKSAGLDDKGFSVHKLRHTAATLMYQNGVDVRVIQTILGHENLNTTQIYTHTVNSQLRDAVNKISLRQGL